MFRNFSSLAFVISLSVTSSLAQAGEIFYSDHTAFATQLGSSITDDYSNPGYEFSNSNAAMTAMLGETSYESTYFTNWNIVGGQTYCAGCNGSFRLTFTGTSVGNSSGVFGVGFNNLSSTPYFAYISFGDGSTQDAQVSTGVGDFWGVTSTAFISSIHFGLAGGGSTTDTYIQIDNLTIGSAGTASVPEPATLLLFGLGLAGLGAAGRRKAA